MPPDSEDQLGGRMCQWYEYIVYYKTTKQKTDKISTTKDNSGNRPPHSPGVSGSSPSYVNGRFNQVDSIVSLRHHDDHMIG